MMGELSSKYPLFFIVGRGRSGTTLLRLLLDTHPSISVAPEAQFIMNLYGKYAGVTKWDDDRILAFYNDLWLEKRLDDWNLNRERLRQDLLACGCRASFADLCRIVYANYAAIQGKGDAVLLGDKNNHYALFVKELMALFPEAKFIHIVRDPRDTIVSYQSVRFDAGSTCALAYRWNRYNQEILKYSNEYPDRFILVRYEDLVMDPVHHLGRICSFLGVDYNPVMLEFYKYQSKNILKWEWHQNLRKPLDRGLVYKWKGIMKDRDVLCSDYICGSLARRFGYESAYPEKSVSLLITTLPGVIYGMVLTYLERCIFFLPLKLRSNIITCYRIVTGSLKPGRQKRE